MGIQIYIKKEALEAAGVKVRYLPGECTYAGEVEELAEVDGLNIVMGSIDDAIYHDANHWGNNRKPILDFINKHELKAGEDWYEA